VYGRINAVPKKFSNKRPHGFTLIELLIVVVIIGIVSGVGLSLINVRQQQNRARDASVKAMINKLSLNTQGHISAYGRHPNEEEFLTAVHNAIINQKDGNSCVIAGAPDDECVFNITGIELPEECNAEGWTGDGRDSAQCFIRYKGNINNESGRFRLYVVSVGQTATLYVYDNFRSGKIHHCPRSVTDADNLNGCAIDNIVPDTDGTGDAGGGGGGSGGGGGGGTDGTGDPGPGPLLPLEIITESLPVGEEGVFYSAQLEGTGGEGAYTWNLVSGSLPPNLTLNLSSGLLSDIPWVSGAYNFTVQLIDALATAITKWFSLIINPAPDPDPVTFGTVTIRGRLVDKFTGAPIFDAGFGWINNERDSTISRTNANGEFSITTGLADIVPGDYIGDYHAFPFGHVEEYGRKTFNFWPVSSTYCYKYLNVLHVTKYADGTATVEIDNFDLQQNIVIPITESEVDLGDIPVWRAVNASVWSDKYLSAELYYQEEAHNGRDGPGQSPAHGQRKVAFQRTHHFGARRFVVDHPVTLELKDASGNTYTPQHITLGTGCHALSRVILWFYNNEFKWILVDNSTPNYPIGFSLDEEFICSDGSRTTDEIDFCGAGAGVPTVPAIMFDGT